MIERMQLLLIAGLCLTFVGCEQPSKEEQLADQLTKAHRAARKADQNFADYCKSINKAPGVDVDRNSGFPIGVCLVPQPAQASASPQPAQAAAPQPPQPKP